VLWDDNKRAHESGADVFLPKPMSRAHLLKLLIQAADKAMENERPSEANDVSKDASKSGISVADVVIALVEDDAVVQMAWEMTFTGGKVICFASPEEFLAKAASEANFVSSLACVVTDLNFDSENSLNGIDFGRELKRRFPNTPVLLSSNATVSEEQVRGAVDAIIPKDPIDSINSLRRFIQKS
jgi:FixJ family two-component response regulator